MSRDSQTITDDAVEPGSLESETDRSTASKARGFLRRAVESGAVAGVGGGLCFLGGRRAFGRGDRGRGLVSFLLGGLFVAVAVAQRRSRKTDDGAERTGIDRLPVVGTSSAVDDATADPTVTPDRDATEVDGEDDASGSADDPADGVLEDADSMAEPTVESDADESESDEDEPVDLEEPGLEEPAPDRIGEAAFDQQSGRIPVPQRVFNNNVLALNAEAFWGIREADDAVVVSQLFDPIQEREGIRYVASTQIDGDRMLTVPDAVLNHWDEVAGGGTAVVSGDGIAFGIDDSLRSDGQLLLVPATWADDLLGDGE